jgi:hypothetical protein
MHHNRKNQADYSPIPGTVLSIQSVKITKEYESLPRKSGRVNYLTKKSTYLPSKTEQKTIIKKEIINHGRGMYIGGNQKTAAFVWIDEDAEASM